MTIIATYGSGASARTDRLVRTFTRRAVAPRHDQDVLRRPDRDGPPRRRHRADAGGRRRPLRRSIPAAADRAGRRRRRPPRARIRGRGREGPADRPIRRVGGRVPAGDFTGARYQQEDGGISLVPAGSSDLQVSALVALTDPDAFSKSMLTGVLRGHPADPKATRERQVYALAGLAGLHADGPAPDPGGGGRRRPDHPRTADARPGRGRPGRREDRPDHRRLADLRLRRGSKADGPGCGSARPSPTASRAPR